MKRSVAALLLTVMFLGIDDVAFADSPARERELSCSDGTTFVGEQVRMGLGRPPQAWRSVAAGDPVLFSFHASSVTAPDGTVVETDTWDNSLGVAQNRELVTCGFVIPIGPFAGYRAEFVGFFVPR